MFLAVREEEKEVVQRADILVTRAINVTNDALSNAKDCAEHTRLDTAHLIEGDTTDTGASPRHTRRRSSAKPSRNVKLFVVAGACQVVLLTTVPLNHVG